MNRRNFVSSTLKAGAVLAVLPETFAAIPATDRRWTHYYINGCDIYRNTGQGWKLVSMERYLPPLKYVPSSEGSIELGAGYAQLLKAKWANP